MLVPKIHESALRSGSIPAQSGVGMQEQIHHAVITGGTGGLGRALSDVFRESGWEVDSTGSGELDVRNAAAVLDYFQNKRVDLLVCAAGTTHDAPLARLTETAWDETWQVNFGGALRCARAVLPGMKAAGNGHIVFISSQSAFHPPPGQTAYAAAKSALIGLTSDLATAYGVLNIRINAILPGFLETRMTESVSEERKKEVLAAHVLGRLNTCRETAAFIHFLHHSLPHTSGQVFQLDSRIRIPRFS